MLSLNLGSNSKQPLKVLCLGAHSDDIEIGVGGTILQMLAHNSNLDFTWVVFSAAGSKREQEARSSADLFLKGARNFEVIVKGYRDGFYPYEGARIKDDFEQLKQQLSPDLIFTHYRTDRHQDHRTIHDLTWNTWRNHLILEYEIPKYDGDLGQPNFFFPLTPEIAKRKAKFICGVFQTQGNKAWMTEDTFLGLMRLRGVECADQYAEAFYSRKVVSDLRCGD